MIGPMYAVSYVAGTLTIGMFWVGIWLAIGAAVEAYEWHHLDADWSSLREAESMAAWFLAAVIMTAYAVAGILGWPLVVARLIAVAVRGRWQAS